MQIECKICLQRLFLRENNIEPTADIIKIFRPAYNFKAIGRINKYTVVKQKNL